VTQPAKKHFTISRPQLEALISHAGEDAVKAALIQNGSQPTEFTLSRPQLEALIERVGEDAVKAALIQNGSAPTDFSVTTKSK
jgi:hypothetical protein